MTTPVNLVPPSVSGSTQIGSILTCNRGTWDSVNTYSYQWKRETGLLSGVFNPIVGDIQQTHLNVPADVNLRVICDLTVDYVTLHATWLGWTIPAIPGGATVVTSKAQLTSILQGGGVSGTSYDATALSALYTDNLIINARYGSETKVWLGTGVVFQESQTYAEASVEVEGAQHLSIYGGAEGAIARGKISNPRGYGLVIRGDNHAGNAPVSNFKWWGIHIDNVAQDGILCHEVTGNVSCDIRGEISRWGQVLYLDPHTTKGSGQHGCYISTTTGSGYHINGFTGVFVIHDGDYGGGCQIGPDIQNAEFQVRGYNLNYTPPVGADGTGGNGIQIFGNNQLNLLVSFLECNNVRKGLNIDSGVSPSNQIQCTHGVVTNYRVSKYDDFPGSSRIAYSDCT